MPPAKHEILPGVRVLLSEPSQQGTALEFGQRVEELLVRFEQSHGQRAQRGQGDGVLEDEAGDGLESLLYHKRICHGDAPERFAWMTMQRRLLHRFTARRIPCLGERLLRQIPYRRPTACITARHANTIAGPSVTPGPG